MNILHVIKDPVHGTMQFTSREDAWIKPFIDSPNFQRMRHIKQLGLGDLIFPGAVHTRFNHCLGCSYVASQIAHQIDLADEERQLVMIACLLHDIGHGPFSHAFEGIFYQKFICHEDWTPWFLADYDNAAFFQHYNRLNPRHHLTAEKFQLIADMIMHKPTVKGVLSDIVSSQLDSDRLDYLLRDSHFCGVKYGEFDFPWLLHCMTRVNAGATERLGVTHKGIGAVEHYLMARRLMTRNIYHSQKKLALESLLVTMLSQLAETLAEKSAFQSICDTPLGQFLVSANQLNRALKAGQPITALKKVFLKENVAIYKALCDYDLFALIRQLALLNDGSPCCEMALRLQQRQMPKIIRVNESAIASIEKRLAAFKQANPGIADWQMMLIQSPHQSYSGEEDPIWVVNEEGKIRPIGDFSFMIHAISDRLEQVAFLAVDKKIANLKGVNAFMEEVSLARL